MMASALFMRLCEIVTPPPSPSPAHDWRLPKDIDRYISVNHHHLYHLRIHVTLCGKGMSWNSARQWFQLLHQIERVACLTQTPRDVLGKEGFP